MAADPSSAARWFSRVVWVGVAANLALAVPTVIMPERMLMMTGLPITNPLLWTQFAGLLLILLSAFYVPAALDPQRYRLVAWLAVLSRLAGVVFFVLFQPREYHMFGYFDLVLFVPEVVLLTAAGRPPSGVPAPASVGGRR
jgi:hypothetical protein